MIKKRLVVGITVLVMLCVFVACGSRDIYRSLAVSSASYQAVKDIANDLYAEGKITETQKSEINKLARKWRLAYRAAVDAAELYDKGFQTIDDVNMAMARAASLLEELQQLLKGRGGDI